jgi:alkaline phosphatase
VFAAALFAVSGVLATSWHGGAPEAAPPPANPTRLILFISDGMGPAHLTAVRDSGVCGALTLGT